MTRLIGPSSVCLKTGAVFSFQGTEKGQAVSWSLIGHDAGHSEVAALGSLSKVITITDSSFCTTNIYTAPTTLPPEGYHDHLTVKAVLV